MFDITPTKTFMDFVHGYVNIPKCFVDNLIDTELFQRLRNIDQTGMRILYPDAKHDRFGHSLGVYHLGEKAVDALLSNFSDDIYWKISSDNKKAIFWAKNKMLFLIACLLHDIGHAPFSHSLESIILKNSFSSETGKPFEKLFLEKFNSMERMKEPELKKINAAPHEILGAMLILDRFRSNIERIYDELIAMKYPQENSIYELFDNNSRNGGIIDKNELDNDICFIARMVTGTKYIGYEPEKQIRNSFIELLNGGNFDVDKLDYIVRDTKMSGISNINIDIERLLSSVCIVLKTKYVGKEFKDKDCSNLTVHSISNLPKEDSEVSEVSIKGRYNGTFILSKNTEVYLEEGSSFISLTNKNNTKIKFIKNKSTQKLEEAYFGNGTKINRDGTFLRPEDDGKVRLSALDNNALFGINIQNATVTSQNGFNFCTDGEMILKVNGLCKLTIKGRWRTDASISFFENTLISGKMEESVFMGNDIEDKLPNVNEYSIFSVGFKKQALNIIANVLEARDYLYLWVYAHHKVIYYANFLIPVLAQELLQSQENDERREFPNWHLDYANLENLDDSYIWTVIKYFKSNSEKPVNELCGEILSRNYKTSLYKSLAEYELIFEEFSIEEKRTLKNFFGRNTDAKKPTIQNVGGDILAGYLKEDVVKRIKKEGNIDNISQIIYVEANYNPKIINTHETYIVVQGKTISLNKIPLLEERFSINKDKKTLSYFYLFYSCECQDKGAKINNLDVISAVKSLCKEVVKDSNEEGLVINSRGL